MRWWEWLLPRRVSVWRARRRDAWLERWYEESKAQERLDAGLCC